MYTQKGLQTLIEPFLESNLENKELLDFLQLILKQNEELEEIAMRYGIPFEEGATEYEFKEKEVKDNSNVEELQKKYDTLLTEYKNRFMGVKLEEKEETENDEEETELEIEELFKPVNKKGEQE